MNIYSLINMWKSLGESLTERRKSRSKKKCSKNRGWIELEEWNESEKEKQVSFSNAYMWNLEKWHKRTRAKTETQM